MKRWVAKAALVMAGSLVFFRAGWAFDTFGESGLFLTPTADTVPLKDFKVGFRILDWPRTGDDLVGGGLIAGVSRNIEVGWGIISWQAQDRNSFGVKYRFYENKETGFKAAAGGTFFIRGGTNTKNDQDGLGYLVFTFPYQFGNLTAGGMFLEDKDRDKRVGVTASIDYAIYPDIVLYYEFASISRITGDVMHSYGLRYQPTSRYPIYLDFGGVSGEFTPGQGFEHMITAAISFGYSERYLERQEEGNL